MMRRCWESYASTMLSRQLFHRGKHNSIESYTFSKRKTQTHHITISKIKYNQNAKHISIKMSPLFIWTQFSCRSFQERKLSQNFYCLHELLPKGQKIAPLKALLIILWTQNYPNLYKKLYSISYEKSLEKHTAYVRLRIKLFEFTIFDKSSNQSNLKKEFTFRPKF
mgnify:CR=1 FL=1